MIVYAEGSAVLSWILGEPDGKAVRELLAGAERVIASTLTRVECARAISRGAASGRLSVRDELAAARMLDVASASWIQLELTGRVLDRARARFPREPIRTLDALHLASALVAQEAHGDVMMLSLDQRIRENAEAMGIETRP